MADLLLAKSAGLKRMSRNGRLRHWQAMAAGMAAVFSLSLAPFAGAYLQLPDQASPESATAQVVAQGVVQIGGGNLRWQVTNRSAVPPANAAPVASDLGFLVVDSGVMLVEDLASGEQFRLPAGEAILTVAGEEQQRVGIGSEASSYRDLSLIAADAALPADGTVVYASEPFAGPDARHDVDLLQDVLAPAGTVAIPDGNLPSLVLIQAGTADVTTDSGDIISLGAGEAASFEGPLNLTAGESGAAITAVFVGPAVPQLSQAASGSAATPAAGRSVTNAQEQGPALPAATPSADNAEASGNDEDGDGLSAKREAELGTDPALSDTDQDGLTDGDEVRKHKTEPLVADTDADGVLDGDEVTQGTNPTDPANATAPVASEAQPATEDAAAVSDEAAAVSAEAPVVEEAPVEEAPVEEAPVEEAPVAEEAPAAVATAGDSDADGLEDAIEFELGTDPYDVDTDDDGLTDGDEYYVFQTGTRNPDSDGDGIVDGQETANGTDPNVPNG